MPRQAKTQEAQEPQEAVETQSKPQSKPQARGKVSVIAKYPPFVDLINDVRIGDVPVEVDMHPWLEAQIGVGLIIVVK